jgi:hypothetical protein
VNPLVDSETRLLIHDIRGFQSMLSPEERVWFWTLLGAGYCPDCGEKDALCQCEKGELP